MGEARLPFFDPSQARGPRRGPDVGQDVTGEVLAHGADRADAGRGRAPLTVSALILRIKGALADAFPQTVAVVGEISNFKLHSSGHMYFRLKDASSAIDVALWRQHAERLKFSPADGLEVVVEGRVDVYDVRGQLQLYAERMTPKGAGALELAFRQLREKLQREGLFDPAAKVAIGRFPRAVGIITSASGAAIRDIRRTLLRRWPAVRAYLLPVLVQGEGAAEEIARAIAATDAAAGRLGIDTIILARGGGSLEDLWAFNEEIVARAIFAARTPIITGIGHETDVTIADLVADLRAATPTAAAVAAVPDAAEVARHVETLHKRLHRSTVESLRAARVDLEAILRSVIFRDPAWRVRTSQQHLDELSHRLRAAQADLAADCRRYLEPLAGRLAALHPAALAERARGMSDRLTGRLAWALGGLSKRAGDALAAVQARLASASPVHHLRLARQQIDAARRHLEALSYRNVLARGYSVTRDRDGEILRSVAQVVHGQEIRTELADGSIDSRVTQTDKAEEPKTGKKGTSNRSPQLFDE
ncbi:MAG: exodeoxyribonuclease VII large subunit [Phycisphaerae bacterium]|nr:exodeoxyribonuclease VII large subunit [Phycisphaerae bacterium]